MAESDKRQDLIGEQGSSFSQTINIFTSPGSTSPEDLTGCTARMQIRDSYGSNSTLVAELNTTNGAITLGGTAGTIGLSISPSDMALIPVRPSNAIPPFTNYVYDVKIVFPSGAEVTVVLGLFTVYAAVTM